MVRSRTAAPSGVATASRGLQRRRVPRAGATSSLAPHADQPASAAPPAAGTYVHSMRFGGRASAGWLGRFGGLLGHHVFAFARAAFVLGSSPRKRASASAERTGLPRAPRPCGVVGGSDRSSRYGRYLYRSGSSANLYLGLAASFFGSFPACCDPACCDTVSRPASLQSSARLQPPAMLQYSASVHCHRALG
jgi:hypothetical protein